jgi:hypothetical protein
MVGIWKMPTAIFILFSLWYLRKREMVLTLCKALRVRTYQILSQSQLTHRVLIIVNPAHLGFTPALIIPNPTSQSPYSNKPCRLRLYPGPCPTPPHRALILMNPAHLGFTLHKRFQLPAASSGITITATKIHNVGKVVNYYSYWLQFRFLPYLEGTGRRKSASLMRKLCPKVMYKIMYSPYHTFSLGQSLAACCINNWLQIANQSIHHQR